MPINKQRKIKSKSIGLDKLDLDRNGLSGDLIHGGVITNFSSTGITDQSTENQITIKDGLVEVRKDVHIKGKILVDELQYVSAQVPKLNVTKAIMIDHNEVLWKNELGRSVKHSNLESVGVLKELQVAKALFVSGKRVGVNTASPSSDFSVLSNGYEIITRHTGETGYVGTHTHSPFSIGTDDTPRLTVKSNGDVITDSKVGVGVKNPTERLEVDGNIRFADRTFASAEQSPTTGTWTTGSIAWNQKPAKGLPVGWVCVKGGAPGSWRPFGLIN